MKTAHCLTGGRVLALAMVISTLLSGCAGSPPWGGWSQSPSPDQTQTLLGRPGAPAYPRNGGTGSVLVSARP